MKKISFLLFFLFFLKLGFTQTKEVQHRIDLVENNLIPYVPVKGFEGWNLIERMKYYKVPGLSIAVINNYKIEWAKGYGVADTLTKTPVTPETMFSAGSISKFLLAVTALKMVDDQKIELDQPINNYLTSWKIAENDFTRKTPITLRMLLSHTAGTSQASYFGFTPNEPLPTITEVLSGAKVAQTRAVVVNSEPNTDFRYSGGGSMIAQLALMDVSKKSFADLTQEILFNKLGMKYSTFEQPVPGKFVKQCSWAYSNASWFKGMPYVYPQQAAAGLYTTPSDLARFFIAIQESYRGKGKILSQALTQKMLTAQVDVSDGGYKEQMGIGPFLIQRTDNQDPKGVYFEFTGVNAGFLAYGMASIEGGNGVIVMLNSGDNQNGIGKEIRRAVAKVYHWPNYLPTEIEPISLSDSELDQLAGRYRMGADEVLYLRKEKNYLVENINNGFEIYCFPIAKDTIVFTDFNIKGFFKRNEKGEVVGLQNYYQDKPMPKMKDDEFSPSEYLKMRDYEAAKKAFAAMHLNEGQITYLAYDLMNAKPMNEKAVLTILELAKEQHPNSSMVYSRWGDYYLKRNDKPNAVKSYQKAIELDPNDTQIKDLLETLK
ncbi:MAG: serine hydrolase [Flavobacterium sp.]|uniref:serine hydrolase n=1 Tax=Flavobacterium sp. TaxID=239 RepID=UPI0022C78EB5|nr:serine hydrolase [Flavobacterium sp.]MCZ8170072.1 serine hydrolase [Flavobacterium sp.]MCZ8297733.1 serine hydrolase [Flavobacterium sp.]